MLNLLNVFEEIFVTDKPEYKEMAFHFDSMLFNMDKINHCGMISRFCWVVRTFNYELSIT